MPPRPCYGSVNTVSGGQCPGDLDITTTSESGPTEPSLQPSAGLGQHTLRGRHGTGRCTPVGTAHICELPTRPMHTLGGGHAPPRLLHVAVQTGHIRFICPQFRAQVPAVPSRTPSPTHPIPRCRRWHWTPGSRTRPPACPVTPGEWLRCGNYWSCSANTRPQNVY